jgi:rubrerythrin
MSGKDYRRLEAYVRAAHGGYYRAIERMENLMSKLVDELVDEVRRNRDVTASAVKLLESLVAKMQDAIDDEDQEKLQSILDEVKADSETLGAAVVANTPSQPAPVPDTPPVEPSEPV